MVNSFLVGETEQVQNDFSTSSTHKSVPGKITPIIW
jgi:hypothetical protein